MKRLIVALAIVASAPIAHAQDSDAPVVISFEGADWRVRAQEAVVETYAGRERAQAHRRADLARRCTVSRTA